MTAETFLNEEIEKPYLSSLKRSYTITLDKGQIAHFAEAYHKAKVKETKEVKLTSSELEEYVKERIKAKVESITDKEIDNYIDDEELIQISAGKSMGIDWYKSQLLK